MDRAMTAKEVLDSHWDGTLPVPLIAIANAMGIRVFKNPSLGYSGKVYLDDQGVPRIVYDSSEPAVRQRYTIAHEIGHVALGHLSSGGVEFRDEAEKFFSTVREPKEVSANKFAARLLMPAERVRTAFLKMADLSIEDMAAMFNVSTAAMRYRLINLGLIRG